MQLALEACDTALSRSQASARHQECDQDVLSEFTLSSRANKGMHALFLVLTMLLVTAAPAATSSRS